MAGVENPNRLPMLAVASVEHLNDRANKYRPSKFQLFVNLRTSLTDAVGLSARVRPGLPGVGFNVFNPEVIVRKLEAEGPARAAVERMTVSVQKASRKLRRTRRMIRRIRELIQRGPDAIRVGPGINHRSLPHAHVLYAEGAEIPLDHEEVPRRLSKRFKLQSRAIDAGSQMAFWQFNLEALETKETAQVAYLQALTNARDELGARLLHSLTLIGSGYSDYTFLY